MSTEQTNTPIIFFLGTYQGPGIKLLTEGGVQGAEYLASSIFGIRKKKEKEKEQEEEEVKDNYSRLDRVYLCNVIIQAHHIIHKNEGYPFQSSPLMTCNIYPGDSTSNSYNFGSPLSITFSVYIALQFEFL